MPSSWKLAVTAIALIGGATFSSAGLLTSASAAQHYTPKTSASISDRHFVATRSESARRRHRYASSRGRYRRAGYFPYARRWHLGKPSEVGFGPRPSGQYRSFEQLDRFP